MISLFVHLVIFTQLQSLIINTAGHRKLEQIFSWIWYSFSL